MTDKVTIDRQALDVWQGKNLEHIRYEYNLNPEDVVIDAGSYQSEFAGKIRSLYGCTVHEFDPLVNHALWIKNGTIKTGGAFYYTSMFEEGENVYPCRDVIEVLSPFSEIALMKINIEGAEYEVLKRMIEFGIHLRIKNLQVQFHYIDGVDARVMYKELALELKKTHELQWQYKFVWESWKKK
jgi:hypothetical protein